MVGRKKIRTQIINTLQGSSRLISLIGTAGVGKSRLALEVIHDLQPTEDHTYFCDLTQANSEIGVALFVAKSMKYFLVRNSSATHKLFKSFGGKKNYELLEPPQLNHGALVARPICPALDGRRVKEMRKVKMLKLVLIDRSSGFLTRSSSNGG